MLLGFNRPPGFTDEDIHDMFCGDPELCEDTDIDPSLLEAIRGINQCGWIYTFACCSSHPNEHPKAQWGCDEYDRSSSPYIGMYVEDHRAEELRGLIKLENDKTTKRGYAIRKIWSELSEKPGWTKIFWYGGFQACVGKFCSIRQLQADLKSFHSFARAL